MKKNLIVLIVLCLSFFPMLVTANELEIKTCEFSEDYLKWLTLTDEERKEAIEPLHCKAEKPRTYKAITPFYYGMDSSYPSSYSITAEGYDTPVKNQNQTGSCWAFAANATIETYMMKHHSALYDLSERHIEYSLTRTFLNNVTNEWGLNRVAGDGGNYYMASSYYYRGQGPIDEAEMPFENNEDVIDISKIENKTTLIDVNDLLITGTTTCTDNTKSIIKKHLMTHGGLSVGIHMTQDEPYFNATTNALFYNGSTSMNHLVTIVGWDDNYSKDNFVEGNLPTANGAWLVRNSWGEDWGNAGYFYISYEDVRVCRYIGGLLEADTELHDNLYFHDPHGANQALGYNIANYDTYAANIFEKENELEVLKEVTVASFDPTNVTVYLVEDASQTISIENAVEIGSDYIENGGYKTIKLTNPILLTHDKFAIIARYNSAYGYPVGVSAKSSGFWNVVTPAAGKSFLSYNGVDFTDLASEGISAIATIKAETDNIDYKIDNIDFIDPAVNNRDGGVIEFTINTSKIDDGEKLEIIVLNDNDEDVTHLFAFNDVYVRNNQAVLNLTVPQNKLEGDKDYQLYIKYGYVQNNIEFSIYKYRDLVISNVNIDKVLYHNTVNNITFDLIATNYSGSQMSVVVKDSLGNDSTSSFTIGSTLIENDALKLTIANNINITPGKYTIGFSVGNHQVNYDITITEYIPATDIVFLKDSMTVGNIGEYQIDYEIVPNNATYIEIDWESSDSNLVEVSNNGSLQIKGRGNVQISAGIVGSSKTPAVINIKSVVSELMLKDKVITGNYKGKPGTLYYTYGGKVALSLLAIDTNDFSIKIAKDNKDVVDDFAYNLSKISETNQLLNIEISKDVKPGIYCVSTEGKYQLDNTTYSKSTSNTECFEVKDTTLVEEIIVKDMIIEEFNNVAINAIIKPELATNQILEYTSSNEDVVKVSEEGVLTGIRAGSATVIVKATDLSEITTSFKVTVIDSLVKDTGYTLLEDEITGIKPPTTLSKFFQELNVMQGVEIKLYSENGKQKTSGNIATGDYLVKTSSDLSKSYSIIVQGDVSKDGLIKSNDALLIERSIVGSASLDYKQQKAANVSKDANIATNDALLIKRYIVGLKSF